MTNLSRILIEGEPDSTLILASTYDTSTFKADTTIFADVSGQWTYSVVNATVLICSNRTAPSAILSVKASQFLMNSATITFCGKGKNKDEITIGTSQTYTCRSKGGSQDDKDIDFIALNTKDGEEGVA